MTHLHSPAKRPLTTHRLEDGWRVLAELFRRNGNWSGDWPIIDDLIETEEFGGLWWW